MMSFSLHFPDDVQLPIPVENFEAHVKRLHANSDHPFSEVYQVTVM